jgi:hypothetical protein
MEKLFEDIAPNAPPASNDWYTNFTQQIKKINDSSTTGDVPITLLNGKNVTVSKKDVAKRALRDQYIYAQKFIIDQKFKVYESRYYSSKSSVDFAGDATTILLTGASTVAMGARVKTILSAVATASAGLSGKASADFYAGQTQTAVAGRMEALREEVWAEITQFIGGDYRYEQYPIESAWADLTGYFYAGTPIAALLDIDKQSGVQKQKASDTQKKNQGIGLTDTQKQSHGSTTSEAPAAMSQPKSQ